MPGQGGLSIMVWSCGPQAPECAATPFVVAQAAAALELEVEMLFTAQAVQWLLLDRRHTPIGFGACMQPVGAYLEACAKDGVKIRACSQALAAAGFTREALVPECCGLGGTVAFVEHTQDPHWRTLVF